MKEYRLKINGGYDFIIISPQTISLLISQIHESSEKEMSVRVEDHFWVSLEQTELWKIWMVVGMPFGIHRMCIWLLPKNFDIGGTVGVWAMNIIVGCLIGEVVVVWYILRAVYVLVKYFVSLLKYNFSGLA